MRYVTAIWSRASLLVKLQPVDRKQIWFGRSLTLDEARAVIRELTAAVEAGQQHFQEMQEKKS